MLNYVNGDFFLFSLISVLDFRHIYAICFKIILVLRIDLNIL